MTNDINAMFINAIGKGRNHKAYKAVYDLGNGKIAFTAAYSRDVLTMVMEDTKKDNPAAKLINIIPQ